MYSPFLKHSVLPYGMPILLITAVLFTERVGAQLWNPLDTIPKPNVVVGLVASETLRLCLAFPEDSRRSDRPGEGVMVRFRVLDTEGDILAQSEEIAVRERQTRCWDIRRAALPRVGEPGTGRLQVRGEVFIKLPPGAAGGRGDKPGFLFSSETIDNNTGETKVEQQKITFLLQELQ